jgi:hypothetical protein
MQLRLPVELVVLPPMNLTTSEKRTSPSTNASMHHLNMYIHTIITCDGLLILSKWDPIIDVGWKCSIMVRLWYYLWYAGKIYELSYELTIPAHGIQVEHFSVSSSGIGQIRKAKYSTVGNIFVHHTCLRVWRCEKEKGDLKIEWENWREVAKSGENGVRCGVENEVRIFDAERTI